MFIMLGAVIIGFLSLVYFYKPKQKLPTMNRAVVNQSERSSTSTLDQYHQSHLTSAQSQLLISNLHDPNKFSTTKDYSLVENCGQSINANIMVSLDATRTLQLVNSVYPIVRTKNLEHWTTQQASTFVNDPTVVCGAGSFFPFDVQLDYILWRQACSTGALPTDINGNLSQQFVACLQAQEAISQNYGLPD